MSLYQIQGIVTAGDDAGDTVKNLENTVNAMLRLDIYYKPNGEGPAINTRDSELTNSQVLLQELESLYRIQRTASRVSHIETADNHGKSERPREKTKSM